MAQQDGIQSETVDDPGRQAPNDDPDRQAGTTEDVGTDDSAETKEREQSDTSPEPEPLSLDHVFEILKNSRRRQTLEYLQDNGGEASLSDLAEHIAAIENDVQVRALSSSQRKRVYVGLYQCHLPKMDGMNIVEFDKNRGTVELGPNASQCDQYIGESDTPDWPRLYASVTAVGVGLLAVSTLGSAPFGLTPAVVLVAFLASIALCSALHAYEEMRDAAGD